MYARSDDTLKTAFSSVRSGTLCQSRKVFVIRHGDIRSENVDMSNDKSYGKYERLCWKAMLQHVVVLSITEAKYMVVTESVEEAIWLRGLLEELGVELRLKVLEAKMVKVFEGREDGVKILRQCRQDHNDRHSPQLSTVTVADQKEPCGRLDVVGLEPNDAVNTQSR
ncbi:hypothetical protein Tco_1053679 [Tanacetum coccineum]|uniref:Uncharacterized protein n=1 Tax=Tanacetum coccineum TaxID=301880 RepID=A0ABQ5GUK8_9ASTR